MKRAIELVPVSLPVCQNKKTRKHDVYGFLVKFDLHLAEKEDPQPSQNSLILQGLGGEKF